MNIFVVDKDPRVAASQLCDKHIVKMPLETSQILNDAMGLLGYRQIMRSFNPKHPSPIWVAENGQNWNWTVAHGIELCEEYKRRYGREHRSFDMIVRLDNLKSILDPCPDYHKAIPIYVGPEVYRTNDVVNSYRNYYNFDKSRFAKWNHSEVPEWYKPGVWQC